MKELEGIALIREIVTLSKSGKSYKHLLPDLKKAVQLHPTVKELVSYLAKRLK